MGGPAQSTKILQRVHGEIIIIDPFHIKMHFFEFW